MESQSESDDRDGEETLLLSFISEKVAEEALKERVGSCHLAKRQQQGECGNLLQEMHLSDPQSHFQYVRMSKEKFDHLLSLVGPLLTKRHYFSRQRAEITPVE